MSTTAEAELLSFYPTIVKRSPLSGQLSLNHNVTLKPNPKYIGVFHDRIYVGYVSRRYNSLSFQARTEDHQAAVRKALLELEENWGQTIKAVGRTTGVCACCGRKLTNPDSLAQGVGPVCAEHWRV